MAKTGQAKQIIENRRGDNFGGWPARTLLEAGDIPIAQIIDSEILVEIEKRLIALNSEISADTGLGPQFRVGHSYVTPPFGIPISDAREWFRQVVDTEIGPLLDEYWFDALEKSQKARERLLEGF